MGSCHKTELQKPKASAFSDKDWHLLSSFWHPVAFSSAVGAVASTTTLLDVELVLARTREGVFVARDYCPHRGAKISLGTIGSDRIKCAYHGVEFGFDGKAVKVPGAPDGYKIPHKLCLQTFRVEERYGIVWVCLSGKPVVSLPEWPIFENTSLQFAKMDVVINTGAGRHIENFCDTSHFPFIHRQSFGNPNDTVVPPYEVKDTEYGLYARIETVQQDGSLFLGEPSYADVPSEYDITLPYSAMLILHFPRGVETIFDIVSPMSAGKCRVFMWKTRDHDLNEPTDEWVAFQNLVNEEDRVLVESEWPSELPIDVHAEIHLPADKLSLAYRRKWAEIGLGGPS